MSMDTGRHHDQFLSPETEKQQLLQAVLKKVYGDGNKKNAEEGLHTLVETVGFETAKQWIDLFSQKFSQGDLSFDLGNFSQVGFEAAQTFFGKERLIQLIEQRKSLDLCSHSIETWTRAASVFQDDPPYTKMLSIFRYVPPRTWLDNLDYLEERLEFMTEDEQKILFQHPETGILLVHDGRRQDWVYYDKLPDERIPGMTHDSEKMISQPAWEAWRSYFGDKWISFLEKGPHAKMLERATPEILTQLLPLIPNLVERLISDEEDIYELSSFSGRDQTYGAPIPFESLLKHNAPEIFAKMNLHDISKALEAITLYKDSDKAFEKLAQQVSHRQLALLIENPYVLSMALNGGEGIKGRAEMISQIFEQWETTDSLIDSDPVLSSFVKTIQMPCPIFV